MMKGRHITIDGNGATNLNDGNYLKNTILELVKLINMNVLFPPVIMEGAEHLPGITSFCVIETSHISIHTFTDIESISIDVYSCKDFDASVVFDFFRNKFEIKDMRTSNLERYL